jgi:hypothetical protein
VADWVFRFLIGSMWWQQTLWKIPPYYTDHPDEPTTTGLYYWMTLEGSRRRSRFRPISSTTSSCRTSICSRRPSTGWSC